jgi:hypothetical protein
MGPRRGQVRVVVFALLGLAVLAVLTADFRVGSFPSPASRWNQESFPAPAWDLWGRAAWTEHPALPAAEAVRIDADLIELGRRTFYRETFGNELFLTDVVGVLDGPVTLWSFTRGLWAVAGEGTTNLKVPIARDATIGGRQFQAGEWVATGIDVPKGGVLPLGLVIRYRGGHVMTGITCALCHSAVDPGTGAVVDGRVNVDLESGLLLALASNSAAYFSHTDADPKQMATRTVPLPDGKTASLPDPRALEDAVDAVLLAWPPGHFDSTIDLVANPTDIPDSYTLGDHPFSWSGFGMAGPFRGLAVFSNNVHAQNSDSLSQAPLAPALFGLDSEAYLAVVLQAAANPRYRWEPESGLLPSQALRAVDPSPEVVGLNALVTPPSFPAVTLTAPDGLHLSLPDETYLRRINAVAAFQDTLVPPGSTQEASVGAQIFLRAGCASCHAGPALTDNRVRRVDEIGTEPSRAASFAKTAAVFRGSGELWAFDTPVPIPEDAQVVRAPVDHLAQDQLAYAWGFDGAGGYKTPSLVGLAWSAPYLHDGAVVVVDGRPGVPSDPGFVPDARASLRALIDRERRAEVIEANRAAGLDRLHIIGEGHPFWVDQESGATAEEQEALLNWLLGYHPPLDELAHAVREPVVQQ